MTTDPQDDKPSETHTAWATAALAEEQRTANLIALAGEIDTHRGGMFYAAGQRVASHPILAEAALRLGLLHQVQDTES